MRANRELIVSLGSRPAVLVALESKYSTRKIYQYNGGSCSPLCSLYSCVIPTGHKIPLPQRLGTIDRLCPAVGEVVFCVKFEPIFVKSLFIQENDIKCHLTLDITENVYIPPSSVTSQANKLPKHLPGIRSPFDDNPLYLQLRTQGLFHDGSTVMFGGCTEMIF